MDKITIPNIGTFKADDLYWFFLHLSRLHACFHAELTEDEMNKLKVATMTAIKEIFSKIEYTEPQSSIRHEHRTFDSDDLEQFYRNMWSHQNKQ